MFQIRQRYPVHLLNDIKNLDYLVPDPLRLRGKELLEISLICHYLPYLYFAKVIYKLHISKFFYSHLTDLGGPPGGSKFFARGTADHLIPGIQLAGGENFF